MLLLQESFLQCSEFLMENAIAVGSTTKTDGLDRFSSRGPSKTGLLKPEISAPGALVRSALHTGDDHYVVASGTHMAAPHVAGVIALMKSADSTLNFNRAKEIITTTAEHGTLKSSGMTCGETKDDAFPNNMFGHGRINAFAAVVASTTPAPTPAPVTECKWSWMRFRCTPRDECRWSWRKFKCILR